MTDTRPESLLVQWDTENNGIAAEASTLPHRFELQSMRILAEGTPVTPEVLADRLSVPKELVDQVLVLARNLGGEWDEKGRLVGSALTLRPTPHEFHVGSRRLYTWCAFDALYLPPLLGRTVTVKSRDPSTKSAIELTVTPEGVAEYTPSSTHVSVLVSGLSGRKGPDSPVCSQMNFFESRDSAEEWVSGRDNVTVMTVEEVDQLIRDHLLPLFEGALRDSD